MMSPGSTAGNVHEQATVPPPSMATSNAPRADLSPAVGTVLGDFELLQELEDQAREMADMVEARWRAEGL